MDLKCPGNLPFTLRNKRYQLRVKIICPLVHSRQILNSFDL